MSTELDDIRARAMHVSVPDQTRSDIFALLIMLKNARESRTQAIALADMMRERTNASLPEREILNRHDGRVTEEVVRGAEGEPDRYRWMVIGHTEDVDVWLETDVTRAVADALLEKTTSGLDLTSREVLVSLSVDGRELWKGYYTAAPWPEDPDPVRDLVGALVTSMDGYDRHGTAARDNALYILQDWLGYL